MLIVCRQQRLLLLIIEPHQTKAPVIGSTFTVRRSPLQGISLIQKISPKKGTGNKSRLVKVAMATMQKNRSKMIFLGHAEANSDLGREFFCLLKQFSF